VDDFIDDRAANRRSRQLCRLIGCEFTAAPPETLFFLNTLTAGASKRPFDRCGRQLTGAAAGTQAAPSAGRPLAAMREMSM
jgi:hypothetical protein